MQRRLIMIIFIIDQVDTSIRFSSRPRCITSMYYFRSIILIFIFIFIYMYVILFLVLLLLSSLGWLFPLSDIQLDFDSFVSFVVLRLARYYYWKYHKYFLVLVVRTSLVLVLLLPSASFMNYKVEVVLL